MSIEISNRDNHITIDDDGRTKIHSADGSAIQHDANSDSVEEASYVLMALKEDADA